MPDFEKLVLDTMDEWKIPGLSIATVHGDKIDTNVGHSHLQVC
jgi:hypothetical protein